MSMFDHEIGKEIIKIATSAGISIFGGSAYYFYRVSKGEAFVFGRFVLSLFLAGFVGYVAGKIMPDVITTDIRDGLIAMAGFSTFPILDLLERKGLFLIAKKMGIEDSSLINQNKDGK